MSQSPIAVTYSLEEVLSQINQKLDNLQKDVTDIKVGQARLEAKLEGVEQKLEAKIDGLSKRLDFQEFVNRGVIIGLILALLGGLAKLLGLSDRL